ncbi:MAG: ATP-binding protein [Bacteroidales bacterium]|nr:ATP-binding protein [Bacteroidales bacterium]MCF8333339.1 ATP-binding protein [Bacteroidales bacterium]
MIQRNIEKELLILAKEFPIVVINGPRQSGKTTLSKMVFPNHDYVSLEEPEFRTLAEEDPNGFFKRFNGNIIIDEVQNVPELFSHLQGLADSTDQMGKYILTGSQNYLVLEQISQSLAGRVGIATLLPFSYDEIANHFTESFEEDNAYILKGSYPPIYDRNIRPYSFYSTYLETYVERDLRRVFNISDLSRFRKMLSLLAGRIGQLLNKHELAVETGVSHVTVENWISMLEASYIVYRLQPWFKNFNKRVVKQPKIYFYDTGLAAYLLGLRDKDSLVLHFARGNLFENMVISEFIKANHNQNSGFSFYFWRNNHKKEIDLVIDAGIRVRALEIKSSQTFRKEFTDTLMYWSELSGLPAKNLLLIYGGNIEFSYKTIKIRNWRSIRKEFMELINTPD